MKDRKQKTIALVAMIVAVVGLSVGFAAFSNNLLIKSRVSVNPDSSKFGVVFSTSSTSEVAGSVIPTKNPTSITATNGTIDNSTTPTISNLSATFTQPGQSATYSFYAYNKGEYLAYLNSITFLGSKTCTAGTGTTQSLVDAACSNISVTVQIGSISTSATKTNITGETIAAGVGKQVTVTLKYEGTARADGPFSVEFGDISMYFASVTGINEGTEKCEIVSGDITTQGSSVKCGTEYFRITTSTTETVTMLAEKNITLTTSNPVQSESAGTLAFADSCFWCVVDETSMPDTKTEYLSNPERIYEESNLPQYVNAYGTTLRNLGINVESITIPTKENVTDLGVLLSETVSIYDSGAYWKIAPSYWTKTFNAGREFFAATSDMGLSNVEYMSLYGIRPLITIPIDQISY